ncbi:hypothetical protein ACOSQ2_012812 [Xanthoceras sorbifolium]
MPYSDVMHNSINLVEVIANPSSQHVALALDPMESSSLNLENIEAAPKNANKSNSIVPPVLKTEKKEGFVTPTSINSVKIGATDCNLNGTRGGKDDDSVVSSNLVGPNTQICEMEGTDPTVG